MGKGRSSLVGPVAAIAVSTVLALVLGRVELGPLFYFDAKPQIVFGPGALSGAVVFFFLIPSIVWLVVRMGSYEDDHADASSG